MDRMSAGGVHRGIVQQVDTANRRLRLMLPNALGGGISTWALPCNDIRQTRAGAVEIHTSNAAPPGWLQCAGQNVSRSVFAELFINIGTAYGVGDGSTTFALPSLQTAADALLGSGKGMYVIRAYSTPQPGDVCWVLFEYGDVNRPVWLGPADLIGAQ
jgi:hypothetical protein